MLEGLRMAQEQQTPTPPAWGGGQALLCRSHPCPSSSILPPYPLRLRLPVHVFSVWPSLPDGSRELWAS